MPWWTEDDYGWQIEERWAAEDAAYRDLHGPACPYCETLDDGPHEETCPMEGPLPDDEELRAGEETTAV